MPPALGAQNLSHWTTKEVPGNFYITTVKCKLDSTCKKYIFKRSFKVTNDIVRFQFLTFTLQKKISQYLNKFRVSDERWDIADLNIYYHKAYF